MYDYTFIGDVATGKTTELSQLVWASLTSVPSSKTLPEQPYTSEEIQAVETDLMRFRTMSPADADAAAGESYNKLQREYRESIQRRTLERERLVEMKWKVRAWDAPEPELCQDIKRQMQASLQLAIDDIEAILIRCQRWCRDVCRSGGEQYREFKIKDLAHRLDGMRSANRQCLKEHERVMAGLQALEQSLGPRK